MMKGIFVICLIFMSLGIANSQEINWMTWEEVSEKMHEEPRKIVVDVYTEWCGWCKKMDGSTFKNKQVVEYINEHYYAIKFDAEYKKTIILNGQNFNFIKSGKRGHHELASKILRGKLSYPSLVFLDYNMKVIQPIPGYRDAKTFNMILHYFDEDHHKSIPWKTYVNNYKKQKKIPNQPESGNLPVKVVGSRGGN